MAGSGLRTRDLHAWIGEAHPLKHIALAFPPRSVTAVVGPAGCGKSTLLRCLNRLHELNPGARIEGRVYLGDVDIYAAGSDPVAIRRRIGMIFEVPTLFPTLSIAANVASGLRLAGLRDSSRIRAAVEGSLRTTGLWLSLKDRLRSSATALSAEQQQRLCIARALALDPEVLLLDDPISNLDAEGSARIENLLHELGRTYTIVVATRDVHAAARVSEYTAFIQAGTLIEHGPTEQLFTAPTDVRTEAFITGRFG